ncbi:alpha/beta hydrolase-fold protein [Adhaeribacter pallidiroseus]|uniref:Ferri-bacillibactin esterase BesA n=1 Tax=Adhaeribacter pallidiroseus TaxID=2072847 RepID=A0A369QPK2_9BACT|nr:alpha/beta hydrolase-fold protein [Adhaeribacter pallidiroseus]RDC65595.1 Ferri-bacillibactin esterase BesA [Adhaeribacter pallidiroseus]
MKNLKISFFIAGFLIGFLLVGPIKAQKVNTLPDSLYSAILKETRKMGVILPQNYKAGNTNKYDVLYILDGEWNTNLAIQLYGFMEYARYIPSNMILVSVPNLYQKDLNLRDRDFTPSAVKDGSVSGGAANFLAFFKNELIPYINQKYPTKKENNTLYGTSLGGLFTVYAFLQEPTLFKSYLTVEPSLWWDNGYVNKMAAQKLPTMAGINNTLWLSVRDGRDYHDMGVAALDSVLQQKAPAGLLWQVAQYPDETHFSTIWKGVYDGLRFSYTGHLHEGNILLKPRNGLVVPGKPFTVECANFFTNTQFRYTTNGQEPTLASATLKKENNFNVSETTTITVKSFSPRQEYTRILRGNFKISAALAAVPKPKAVQPGGLRYTYYAGNYQKWPDLKKLKPVQSGLAGKDFNGNNFQNSGGFACLVEGFLEVPEEGYYIFQMADDSTSRVYLGKELIMGQNNVAGTGQSYLLPLQKGFYPIRVEYLQKPGGPRLSPIWWKPAHQADTMIPLELLYSRTKT